MPTISCSSTVRDRNESLSLTLVARYVLVYGHPSEAVLNLKGRVPDIVDVVQKSSLVFSLSGQFDGSEVSSLDIKHSALASHVLHYLKSNATSLDLSSVSDIYIDDDNRAKFMTSSGRHNGLEIMAPYLTLVSIELRFICKSLSQSQTLGVNPFACTLYLPFVSILDRIVHKFVVYHLVKRYPQIFGPWRAKIDIETRNFNPISRSITRVIDRSPNAAFRTKCHRIIKRIRRQNLSAASITSAAVSSYLDSTTPEQENSGSDNLGRIESCTNEEHLYNSMLLLLKSQVRPTRFKALKTRLGDKDDTDLSTTALISTESSSLLSVGHFRELLSEHRNEDPFNDWPLSLSVFSGSNGLNGLSDQPDDNAGLWSDDDELAPSDTSADEWLNSTKLLSGPLKIPLPVSRSDPVDIWMEDEGSEADVPCSLSNHPLKPNYSDTKGSSTPELPSPQSLHNSEHASQVLDSLDYDDFDDFFSGSLSDEELWLPLTE